VTGSFYSINFGPPRAVIDYLARVSGSTGRLGAEPERYYELAAADANAEPSPPQHPAIAALGTQVSVPLLPAAPAGSDDDEAHGMVRIMCEEIANAKRPARALIDKGGRTVRWAWRKIRRRSLW
jgi:hypothetical protein